MLRHVDGLKSLRYSILLGSIGGFLDLIAFSALLPLLLNLVYPNSLQRIPYLETLRDFGNIEETNHLFFIVILGSAILVKNLILLIFTKKQLKIIYSIATRLTEVLVTKYYEQDYQAYLSKNSSEVSKVISTTPLSFSHNIFRSIQYIVSELIVTVFISIFLLIASPLAFAISLVSVALLSVFIWFFVKKRAQELDEKFKNIFSLVTKELYTAIDHYLSIRIMRRSHYFVDRFLKLYHSRNLFNAQSEFYKVMSGRIFEIFGLAGFILIYLLIHYEILESEGVVLLMTIFTIALYKVIPITNKILSHATIIKANQHLVDILEHNLKETSEPVIEKEVVVFNDKIELDEIAFSYNRTSKKVLNGINMKIQKGDWLGIVGESGSGKSTLLKIVLGVLQPQAGSVSIDGVSLEKVHLEDWFSKVGYMHQSSDVIDASLAENISFGEPIDANREGRIHGLLKQLGLEELAQQQTDGIYTLLGERGAKISGGQAKRICLARVLFNNAQVLLLDEFANETDTASNEVLLSHLYQLNRDGMTIIQVSHQMDALKYCTKIYKFEGPDRLSLVGH